MNFDSLTYIVGPNDAGKTNVLRSFAFLARILEDRSFDTQDLYHELDVTNPFEVQFEVEFTTEEREALVNSCICSFGTESWAQLSKNLPTGGFAEENKREITRKLIQFYGNQIFNPLFEESVLVMIRGPYKMGYPPSLTFQFRSGERKLYFHDFETITNSEFESQGGYIHIPAVQVLREGLEKFFGTENIGSKTQNISFENAHFVDESLNIFDLARKVEKGNRVGLSLSRNRAINIENLTGRFEPLRSLNSYFLKRGISIDNNSTIGLYDSLATIFKTCVVNLTESSLSSNEEGIYLENLNEDSPRILPITRLNLPGILFLMENSKSRIFSEAFKKLRHLFGDLTGGMELDIVVRPDTSFVDSTKDVVFTIDSSYVQGRNPFSRDASGPIPLGLSLKDSDKRKHRISIIVSKKGRRFPLDALGQGISQILLLSTAMALINDGIVIIDEPELSLHPLLQRRLLNRVLRECKSGVQFIIVTHSPYLLGDEWIDKTYRISKPDVDSIVRKVKETSEVLSKEIQDVQERSKLLRFVSSPDFKSLLFSKGVVIVEGPSDKIVIEELDRHLANEGKGASLRDNEWFVIDSGGVNSIGTVMKFARKIDLGIIAISDLDGLVPNNPSSLPAVFRALDEVSILSEEDKAAILRLNSEILKITGGKKLEGSNTKLDSILQESISIGLKCRVFVFQKDLETALNIPTTSNGNKPWNAFRKVVDVIAGDEIPIEIDDLFQALRTWIKEFE